MFHTTSVKHLGSGIYPNIERFTRLYAGISGNTVVIPAPGSEVRGKLMPDSREIPSSFRP